MLLILNGKIQEIFIKYISDIGMLKRFIIFSGLRQWGGGGH